MSKLKVVALISGGKDSFFSLLHCIANGHDVVALANLYPASPSEGTSVEDTDSFMYQTIGHAVIPLYEKALGLPLYRQEINGSAVNQSKTYGPTPNDAEKADETESLVPLLRKVMAAHPEVNAVSTGAILSDYQRTRVESVALRLGLTPLSYLWQYPHLPPGTQTSLLEDMAAVGQDARIIKVASGGMDESFLWQNVADHRTKNRLVKASQRFGTDGDGAALGEGGEYETLAIAGPAPLWKARIVVDEGDRSNLPGEAGSASVKIAKADIAPLEEAENQQVRTPELLDERFAKLLEVMGEAPADANQLTYSTLPIREAETPRTDSILIGSLTAPGANASEQTEAIMSQLKAKLSEAGHGFSDIAYTSIILRNMADFAAVNVAYGKCFQHPSPPARITLSCAGVLPQGALVTISTTSMAPSPSKSRKGLHVQSRSYWAPANIGPYSQAITVPASLQDGFESELVYVAGQIPLEPASMELYSPCGHDTAETFLHQSVLALQHLYRIGAAVSVRRWLSVIAFITAQSAEDATSRANVARRVWQEAHEPSGQEKTGEDDEEEDEAFDVWDQQRGGGRAAWQTNAADEKDASPQDEQSVPPIYVIEVDSLPRGASIEWVAYGTTKSEQGEVINLHLTHLLQMFGGCLR
jgi:diphthine-ammonia ligase